MESCPPLQRSFPSQQPLDDSFEDSTLHSRHRQPLADSDSAGNAQQAFDSNILSHHESKAIRPHVDRPPASYIVPSQPSRQPLGNTLVLRKQSHRKQRRDRFENQNPIIGSPQYLAYRSRQTRDGPNEDAKWPDQLELAFLDALLFIPKMGRRKFSMRGKPYGRNELISEYIWLSYVQSLTPGEVPDESMRRVRKQVSSHIQVLKGFMKGHPASDRLFSKTTPANGFEDSFKHDPCLIALQENRVWTPYSENPSRHGNRTTPQHQTSIKPVVFWLLITKSSEPDDTRRGYAGDETKSRDGALVHKYTELQLHSQRDRENLEIVSNWRERFPYMARLPSLNELNCEIIHMNVSLDLIGEYAPSGAELVTRMEITIPGSAYGKHRWQTVTSLIKPQELYYADMSHDPPLDRKKFIAEVLDMNGTHTRIKIPFPANTWAHALSNLTNLQHAYDDGRNAELLEGESTRGPTKRVRDYIEQISMYQEVQSASKCSDCIHGSLNSVLRTSRCMCGGRGYTFETRAIILWTFNKARRGEGSTTWRYIDPVPPRRMLMSPSPHPSQHIAASMSEHFNSWAETPMHLQNHNLLDSFVQGLVTPPNTAGLHSPFVPGYGYTPNNFEASQETLGFLSHSTTVDSESTMVENISTPTIDNFLSHTAVNLEDFSQHSSNWHIPHSESFDADPAWANYNAPTSTPQTTWENDGKNHVWPETTLAKNHVWPDTSPTKQVAWIDEGHGKHEHEQLWHDVMPIPTKADEGFLGATLEHKLGPWIETHGERGGNVERFHHEGGSQLPELGNEMGNRGAAKEHAWTGEEGFQYEHLEGRMK